MTHTDTATDFEYNQNNYAKTRERTAQLPVERLENPNAMQKSKKKQFVQSVHSTDLHNA